MRVFRVSENRYVPQREHGEKLKERSRLVADEQGVGAGSLRGSGAAERVAPDFSHLAESRQHEGFVVDEATEVANLVGSLSRGECGEPIPHTHAILRRPDGTVLGGQTRDLVVGATLDVDVEVMPRVLRCRIDPRMGVHILDAHRASDDS